MSILRLFEPKVDFGAAGSRRRGYTLFNKLVDTVHVKRKLAYNLGHTFCLISGLQK